MHQHGQVFTLKSAGPGGRRLWAYRYRSGGRDSRRVQHGGFTSQRDARQALDRALESLRRRSGTGRPLTLSALVHEYMAQHEAEPETTEKLRWLLAKSAARFGEQPIGELSAREIAAWRMTLPAGHRFEATQALRQVLARAMQWQLIDTNPAKLGVDNPPPKRKEQRPFESWDEVHRVARATGRYGPLVIFAAATGLRPGEWIALEHRDIDHQAAVVHVRRAYRNGRLKYPKTTGSTRAVPLQQIALDALDQLPPPKRFGSPLVFPAPRGEHLDLHNFRSRQWKPALAQARIDPPRRIYDLRHTFATFALRAGINTFDLSRYMGASLTMIDRHYGHLAPDGYEHAIALLDTHTGATPHQPKVNIGGRPVDAGNLTDRPPISPESRR